jgi:hypothetical protein
LLPYLLPRRYYGIEPNQWLVEEGIKSELGQDIVNLKQPTFHYSDAFDFDAFGVKFDYMVAQSIFSHTGSDLVRQVLANAAKVMHDETKFVATFIHSSKRRPARDEPGWHYPKCISFDPDVIKGLIREAGLFGQYLPWYHPAQDWYMITMKPQGLLAREDVAKLHGLVFFGSKPAWGAGRVDSAATKE